LRILNKIVNLLKIRADGRDALAGEVLLLLPPGSNKPMKLPPSMTWIALMGGAVLALALACGASEEPLQITLIPPSTGTPVQGTLVVFQVATEGGGTPRFQWIKNGLPIPGATSATLTLGPVAPADVGSYLVQVTDGSTSLATAPFDLEPVNDPWVVTSAADTGPGTLRDILAQASAFPGVNGIQFALPGPGPYTITLQSTLPAVTGNICILGPYASPLTVDGGGVCRPLFLASGTLVLDNFTVAHGLGKGGDALGGGGGAAGMGGALFVNAGSLSLRRMTFLGNQALGGSSIPGTDGENGGGGGFGGDSLVNGGVGAGGGLLGGKGGQGYLDGTNGGGSPGVGGSGGAGGGAARGGPLADPTLAWTDNEAGGDGDFGGGGGFSVGPEGGGGGSSFGGGGGGSGGSYLGMVFPGAAKGEAGFFGGDGGKVGQGGGGGGLGGALFLRAGKLAMYQCVFDGNQALPGSGDETGGDLQALAAGKGGAVFIYPYDDTNNAPLYLSLLQAQSYSGNTATDLVESPTYDNDNYYIAQTLLPGVKPGSPLDLLYRRYRQFRKLGLPWVRQ
jgi:hypothetical protein